MTKSRKNLGKWGENRAVAHLLDHGYLILERNYHTSYGEIDIVVHKNDITIFVEVKTRNSKTYGYPEESITPLKKEHMINASHAYLVEHPELEGNWQIDVISISQIKRDKYEIIHFENAVSE
jgi:putative endonuclease